MLHTLLKVTLRPVHLQKHICTGLSMLSQDCASWTAQSPQLHAFSHLLLGCCDAAALRRSREDIFTVLNSVCFSRQICSRAVFNERPQIQNDSRWLAAQSACMRRQHHVARMEQPRHIGCAVTPMCFTTHLALSDKLMSCAATCRLHP